MDKSLESVMARPFPVARRSDPQPMPDLKLGTQVKEKKKANPSKALQQTLGFPTRGLKRLSTENDFMTN